MRNTNRFQWKKKIYILIPTAEGLAIEQMHPYFSMAAHKASLGGFQRGRD
jgi:hypothetical protein